MPDSRRIVAAGVPGEAAADAPDAAARAANRSVFLHGFDEVDAATRIEAALVPEHWAEEDLIEPDQPYQEQGWDSRYGA